VPLICLRKALAPVKRLPVVIVLHGTRGNKEQMLPHLKRYANEGYLSCAVDTRYHGERGTIEQYYEALLRAYHANARGDEHAEHPFMYDSSWDVMRVLDWLVSRDDVDTARIGLTGISLGGMHTWLTAACDERVAAAAPLIGVQGYWYALEHDVWHERVDSIRPFFDEVLKMLRKEEMSAEVVEDVWKRLCPGLVDSDRLVDAPSSLRLIAPRPLLVANGEEDMRCPKAGVCEALESARNEYARFDAGDMVNLHFEPGCGHEVKPEMWRQVDAFFSKHLRPIAGDFI
jgi:predicted esterase